MNWLRGHGALGQGRQVESNQTGGATKAILHKVGTDGRKIRQLTEAR